MSLEIQFKPGTLEMTLFHNGEPILYQPDKPSGEPWASQEEAAAWAEEYYAERFALPVEE